VSCGSPCRGTCCARQGPQQCSPDRLPNSQVRTGCYRSKSPTLSLLGCLVRLKVRRMQEQVNEQGIERQLTCQVDSCLFHLQLVCIIMHRPHQLLLVGIPVEELWQGQVVRPHKLRHLHDLPIDVESDPTKRQIPDYLIARPSNLNRYLINNLIQTDTDHPHPTHSRHTCIHIQ
jgi:hypothetical protein